MSSYLSTPSTHIQVILYHDDLVNPLKFRLPFPASVALTPAASHAAILDAFPALEDASDIKVLPLEDLKREGYRTVVCGRETLFGDLEQMWCNEQSRSSSAAVEQDNLRQEVKSLKIKVESHSKKMDQLINSLASERIADKKRYIYDREAQLLYAVRKILSLRLEGRVPTQQAHNRPHPAIKQLHAAAAGGHQLSALLKICPFASRFFNHNTVRRFNAAIDANARHLACHAELTPPKLLSDLAFLEMVQREEESGDKALVVSSIALKFLLMAWGARFSRETRDFLLRDTSGVYLPLDPVQLERLEMFF